MASLGVASPRLGMSQQWNVALPPVPAATAGPSTRTVSAVEAAAHAATRFGQVYGEAVNYRRADVPLDSIRMIGAAASLQWLAAAQRAPIRGIQLEPSGQVAVMANQEEYAKVQIAARLATPGLSFADKASALQTGVFAFADHRVPRRLATSEAYLRQLDALGDSAALWRYRARMRLVQAYYVLGRSPDVIRHGVDALMLLPRMHYAYRDIFYGLPDDPVYGATVEALTGQADGRARIERLNQVIREAAIPSPQLVATDSTYDFVRGFFQLRADRLITGNAKLGTIAAPLTGHYWFNTAGEAPAVPIAVPVNDGKIRVVEIAHMSCGPCQMEVYALERLKQRYPTVEPVLLTWTIGAVANRLVDAETEVGDLKKFLMTQAKVTYPIGVWAGTKVPNDEGGMTPESPAYFRQDYPGFGKPMTWIIDGNGMIRRIFTRYDRNIETQIHRTIEFLVREAAQTRTASATTNVTSPDTAAQNVVRGHP
jgi:hypothetical protein